MLNLRNQTDDNSITDAITLISERLDQKRLLQLPNSYLALYKAYSGWTPSVAESTAIYFGKLDFFNFLRLSIVNSAEV